MKIILTILIVIFVYNVNNAQSRYYNTCESLYNQNNPHLYDKIFTPFIWNGNAINIIQDSLGTSHTDTVWIKSIAQVLDVYSTSLYNNNKYKGEIGVGINDYYTLDSIYIDGYYKRNILKPHVVDTLRVNFIRDKDLFYSRSQDEVGNPWVSQNYGRDTIFWVSMLRDTMKNIAQPADGGSDLVFDIYLDSASVNQRTYTGLFNEYSIGNINLDLGLKERFGLSVTFISGDTSLQDWDTLYMGSSVLQDSGFRFNVFMPLAFERSLNSYPLYQPDDYNVSSISTRSTLSEIYVPAYNFSSAFPYDYWYIDYIVNCNTCIYLNNSHSNLNSGCSILENPCKEKLQLIGLNEEKSSIDRLNLMDNMGRLYSIRIHESYDHYISADVSSLPPGEYMVRVEEKVLRFMHR